MAVCGHAFWSYGERARRRAAGLLVGFGHTRDQPAEGEASPAPAQRNDLDAGQSGWRCRAESCRLCQKSVTECRGHPGIGEPAATTHNGHLPPAGDRRCPLRHGQPRNEGGSATATFQHTHRTQPSQRSSSQSSSQPMITRPGGYRRIIFSADASGPDVHRSCRLVVRPVRWLRGAWKRAARWSPSTRINSKESTRPSGNGSSQPRQARTSAHWRPDRHS